MALLEERIENATAALPGMAVGPENRVICPGTHFQEGLMDGGIGRGGSQRNVLGGVLATCSTSPLTATAAAAVKQAPKIAASTRFVRL